MTRAYVSKALRELVAVDAGNQCGYCQMPQALMTQRLFMDHLLPSSRGGLTVRDNLWQSCWTCNTFKGNRTHFRDPKTERLVSLFNPRTQRWLDHFEWDATGVRLLGLTAIGRATVNALNRNNELSVAHRVAWSQVGRFPPKTGPRESAF